MNAVDVVARVLTGLVPVLEALGKVVAAKRVEEIIRDEFPEFYERAQAAGEQQRRLFDGGGK